MRDRNLDFFRGIIMMYIVCIIHGICWMGYEKEVEPIFSFLLFEMPVIFFISGASVSMSKNKSIWNTFKNRFIRVIVPYYIYAALSLLLILLFTIFSFEDYDICQYTIGNVIRILLTLDIPQMPFIAHLWFIIPYMVLLSTFSIQRYMINTYRGRYLCACILAFALTQTNIDFPDLLKTILGYNIFLVAGYCFYKHISIQIILFILLGSIALIVVILLNGITFHSMQVHKFPPDFLFVTYGSAALCILSLLFWKFRAPENCIVSVWNKKGFTIYLYQNIIFYIFHLMRVKHSL